MWVVPGTHKRNQFTKENRQGIPSTWEEGKYTGRNVATSQGGIFRPGEMAFLLEAVPMLMNPGDLGMHNRSCLHGAFPNKDPASPARATIVFGFHNRRFVLGTWKRDRIGKSQVAEVRALGTVVDADNRVLMDEAFVHQSTRMIQVAIDARRQRYPDETPYVYAPLVGEEEQNRWNAQTRETIVNSEGRWAISL